VDSEERQGIGRAIEILAAVLLGLGTFGSAWCALEAARWNRAEADEYREAAYARVEASRTYAFATQAIAYDAIIAAQYAEAVVAGREDLQRFYRNNLVRDAFLPVIEQWQAQVASAGRTTGSLFENTQYIDSQFEESRRLTSVADGAAERADAAGDTTDQYVLTTLFMASVLFFAGITSNFRSTSIQGALIAIAAILFAIGAARVADLPVS
jgi:hypothetical protein